MSNQKRLFLLDAFALIFRGYYAFIKNPRINSKGLNTSAVLGFMNSLLDVIRREKPDHLAVAFDKGGSDFRNEIFPTYKANRDETPEAISTAIPYIKELLKAMHIPIIEKAGFEADDLIGTLAKQAEKENYKVFMVTPDKDFAQLVSENIFIYKPARSGNDIEIWGVEEVKKNFEIDDPLQVIDFLGMKGDAVDNIPGLPGVGDVTAKKLLKEFGSIENLIANTHLLKGTIKDKIEANAAQGLLSKKLATIILDCPVTFDEKDYELSQPDFDKVTTLFEELEFRQMRMQFDKIFNLSTAMPESQPIKTPSKNAQPIFDLFSDHQESQDLSMGSNYNNLSNTPHHYQVVSQGLGFDLFLKTLLVQKSVCFDTETTSLKTLDAELVGIAFSWENHKGFYLPISENKEEAQNILNQLKPFFENEKIEKVGQNMKYDIKILFNYGIHIKGPKFDTMIAHYLINPDMRHNMDVLSETYLNYSPKSIEELIGKKGKGQKSMRDVSMEEIKEYAVEDADITWQLKAHFETILNETQTKKIFDELEMPLVEVLAHMEYEGINLDVDFLKSLSQDLTNDIKSLEFKIYEAAGHSFNIGSPKQLGDILFEELKIGGSKPKKTKTGQYATGEEILSYLVKSHPIVQDILDYRQLIKLQNTYVEALPNQVNSKTKRVHTDYMQTVAATGRLSSNNPNLQNIPIRTERGRQIRKAFIAKNNDYILLAADYSQIELRIIAALSHEDNMIEAFKNNEDIHRSTASKVFNLPLDDVSKEQRSHAKTVNFGIIYGVSAFGLSNQTSLTRIESAQLIEQYYQTYPKLKQYIQDQINFARQHGYVQTILGRRRYLPDIHSANAVVRGQAERNAVNAPIQGSAADIIKIAMIKINQALEEKQMQSKMLLQVHDELVFDAYKPELDQLKALVTDCMQSAFSLEVPLIVDLGEGINWLEAH
jgi:DNA polymerase-1